MTSAFRGLRLQLSPRRTSTKARAGGDHSLRVYAVNSGRPSLSFGRADPRLGVEMQAPRLADSIPQTGDALQATLYLEKAEL